MKNSSKIYVIVLIAALCIGAYSFAHRSTEIDKGSSGTNSTTRTAQLTLVPFSYFESDEGGGLHFYQVSTTSNQSIPPALIEKMNTALATDYCGISRPDQPDYRAKIEEELTLWEKTARNENALPQNWRSWNAEQMRQTLITNYHFEHGSKQAIAYNQNGLLSIMQDSWDYCGGAYPNSINTGITLNTSTGENIQFPDLFANFEHDKKDIANIVYGVYTDSLKADPTNPDQECRDVVNEFMHLGNDLQYTAFTLTPADIRIQSLGFPHALQVCEPRGDITIPYTKLSAYMKESILSAVEPVIRD